MKDAVKLATLSVMIGMSVNSHAQNSGEPVPGIDELWRIVQAQQDEIERLQQALQSSQSQARNVEIQMLETTENLEAIAEVLDQPQMRGNSSWADRTSIGGYGEMLYNGETASSSSKELDVQRFVLFLAHEFNENLRFFSELELEHGLVEGDGPGAVELEQAYLEWDYADNHSVLAGMFLAPLGIINETHEPNTFYGVERNLVESRLIPSTYPNRSNNWQAMVACHSDPSQLWCDPLSEVASTACDQSARWHRSPIRARLVLIPNSLECSTFGRLLLLE